ncbi:hypothetical protein [Rosistilla carotiformis]|uniref:hypothetical protein n=1 Tax=Rosistilla carotiformis TaxID=2528017 RepID=UPI00119E621B|nr:hypothetical protein [Rosistilla carotiformis]
MIINLVATLFLVGLIWTIQVVHYPLFDGVGKRRFIVYQRRHQFLITFIVGPPMLSEAISSLLLVFYLPAEIPKSAALFGLFLVIAIWISTAAIQVPCHRSLANGYRSDVHRWLVRSNWIRTAAWTARGALVIWMIVKVLTMNHL